MLHIDQLATHWVGLVFLMGAVVIGFIGTRMVHVAVEIADRTGMGQAITGAVFVGIATSLSGTILSFYTAGQNHPDLSISNSVGGIAAQTAFLGLADLTYKRANLEHAAASLANLAQGALLMILLAIPLIAMTGPEWTLFSIHPATIILVAVYIYGLKIVSATRFQPMWTPRHTVETQEEGSEEGEEPTHEAEVTGHPEASLPWLFGSFGIYALILGITGIAVSESAIAIAARTGLSESLMGGIFTSVCTSLPELVTTLIAVRQGALNLAVGDIIGGNSFDVLFLAGSDIFYRPGSIYHMINSSHILIISMSVLMTGVLLLGMLRREKEGPARIGFESVIMLGLYAVLVMLLFILS